MATYLSPLPGEPPWISEMYGYMFGAAEQGVDTSLTRGVVQYTDAGNARAHPSGPAIIHYGLHCHVGRHPQP
jgi:hypothetical protein